ncbi:PhnB protein [Reichenbachiella faecimaris]|uniref:PhnB protein n=1 Tax=Reichenbachiella faecimaris TaxID=692418 RepID=A0A1W2G8S8_REIFA|nr:VOC family protein [Reichenbachiella faecimaris]SMD33077.1 PhnB protein [Reichenbachiella faecimaris]
MNKITTYLNFNGNCKEAMHYYQRCFGGDLRLQTIGESPYGEAFPKEIRGHILEATLAMNASILKGSDLVDDYLTPGNTITILLECENERELNEYYKRLSADGVSEQPITTNHYGGSFVMVNDRFGFNWQLRSKQSL